MNTQNQLIDFDQLWDYQSPVETEQKFRALLPAAQTVPAYHAELLTQLARTQSLQHNFLEAHKLLDQVEAMLTPDLKRARIRYLLERGRTFNSDNQPDKARSLFLEAWQLGQDADEDFHAIDAAHMVAIVEPADKQLAWNLKALALTDQTKDSRAKKWIGSLNNNIGWAYFDQGNYQQALHHFRLSLAYQETVGNETMIRIGRWSVAKGLRMLGQVTEALAIQQALLALYTAENEQDGYVVEEIGECLLRLDHGQEASPYFQQAYNILSQDPWLVQHEPNRLDRLKRLGGE